MNDAPCERCDFQSLCASKVLACRQFVSWTNADSKYALRERRPNRLDYYLLGDELNIQQLKAVVARVRRVARREERMPTYSEIAAAAGIDSDAVAELVTIYARKQGMREAGVAFDDRAIQRGEK